MSGWTYGWLSIAAAIAVLEAFALFNRKRGDTLSEHVWLLLGVFPKPVCQLDGRPIPCPQHGAAHSVRPPQSRRLPPAWVRIRRAVFISFAAWLVLHFTTGWV